MNQRVAAFGAAFLIGIFLIAVTFHGTSQTAGALTFNSPVGGTSIPRQGVSSALFPGNQPTLTQLGAWAAIWGPYNGVYPSNFQVVPMLVWSQTLPSAMTVANIASAKGHEYWLVFNECEQIGQCKEPPSIQAQFYHDQVLPLINQADPDAKLIIGGTEAHECGLSWLTKFVTAYRSMYSQDPPRAGWHFHIYADVIPKSNYWQPGQPCPDAWQGWPLGRSVTIADYVAQANAIRHWWSLYGSPDDEIWVSETGCLGGSPSPCPDNNTNSYIASITAYLNSGGRWIDRYAWFTDNDYQDHQFQFQTSWLMTKSPASQFTGIGAYYRNVQVATHVPGFQYLQFLAIILNNNGSGANPMIQPAPFISPLPTLNATTFNSPLLSATP